MTGDPQALTPARLPWNTTRTMADVWGLTEAAARRKLAAAAKNRERHERFVADHNRHSNLPTFTPSGKIAFAGYDPTDYWNGK